MFLDIIKVFFVFLFRVIFMNPFKFILLTLSIVSFQFVDYFPEVERSFKYEKTLTDRENEYEYLKFIKSSSVYKIVDFDELKNYTITDTEIKYTDTNNFTIITWVIFGLSTLALIILCVVNMLERPDMFNLGEHFMYALLFAVKIYREDDMYYYISFNRLLLKREGGVSSFESLLYHSDVKSISSFLLAVKPETVALTRMNKFEKLGI